MFPNSHHDIIKKMFKFAEVMKPPVVSVTGSYMNEAKEWVFHLPQCEVAALSAMNGGRSQSFSNLLVP